MECFHSNSIWFPRSTHRYLIEPISRWLHIKTLLPSRFVAFSERINSTNMSSICLLYSLFKNDEERKFNVFKVTRWSAFENTSHLWTARSNNFSVDDFNYHEFNEIICFYVLTNKWYSIFTCVPLLNYVFVLNYCTILCLRNKL